VYSAGHSRNISIINYYTKDLVVYTAPLNNLLFGWNVLTYSAYEIEVLGFVVFTKRP
jgi:hypothetical protein